MEKTKQPLNKQPKSWSGRSSMVTSKKFMADLSSSCMKSLLDELSKTSAIFDLIDLIQLFIDTLFWIKIPDIQPHSILLHTIDISAIYNLLEFGVFLFLKHNRRKKYRWTNWHIFHAQ